MKAIRLLFAIVAGTIVLALMVSCAMAQQTANPNPVVAADPAASVRAIPPLALLLDASATTSKAADRMQQRSQLETLLSFVPPGTPFVLIAFNRDARLVHRGLLSTADALTALAELDTVKRAGPTDLGAALDMVGKQPGFAHANCVILSDFYLAPPAKSPWAHTGLDTLLNTANAHGIDHFLLVPIGASNTAALNNLPVSSQVLRLGQSPAPWLHGLVPPPPPIPVTSTAWPHRSSFLFCMFLVVLLAGGAVAAYTRQRELGRIALQRRRLSAPPRSNEVETPNITSIDAPGHPGSRTRSSFVVTLVEEGKETVLDNKPFLVGASPLAEYFIPDAATTLQLSVAPDKSHCIIKNVGGRDVFIGQELLPRGSSITLRFGSSAQCALAPGTTLSIDFITVNEEAA